MKVIIMRGPSGCGKSTWIEKNHPGANVCSADSFFTDEEGEYNFDPSKLAEAHQKCFQEFLFALGGDDEVVIVDNTNMRWWEYVNYVMAANMCSGFHVSPHIVQFVPETIAELKLCFERGKHGTPPGVIAMQGWNYEDPKSFRPRNQSLFTHTAESLTIVDADLGLTPTPLRDALELWFAEKGHWDYHPDHPVEDWRLEVREAATNQSYADWALSQAEAKDLENVTNTES